LAARWGIAVSAERGLYSLARGHADGQAVGLLKPLTFMNRSGQAVLEVVQFYKVELADLLVIFDDLDLPVGRVRVRAQGSAGGHKGLGDIIGRLGSEDLARVRIGIGRPAHGDAVAYVLNRCEPEEEPLLEAALDRAADAAACWLAQGSSAAMNRYNGPE
jgi:PTH1 family peptidyl-tRNA hydrolase